MDSLTTATGRLDFVQRLLLKYIYLSLGSRTHLCTLVHVYRILHIWCAYSNTGLVRYAYSYGVSTSLVFTTTSLLDHPISLYGRRALTTLFMYTCDKDPIWNLGHVLLSLPT